MAPRRLTLDSPSLERLFAAWSVPLPPLSAAPLVLFALRGATPETPPRKAKSTRDRTPGWSPRATVTLTPVDHVHMRCTIGVWDRAGGRVFVAPGSTVPHRDNVVKAAARKGVMKGRGTNQLEPGFYTDLAKGEHLQGKPQGHAALRQTGYRFYRRAQLTANASGLRLPLYTARDPLYFGNPYDNLHCAWNRDPKGEGFRSAGCVVVAGWPHSPRLAEVAPALNQNDGAWKTFHDLIYAVPQRRFPLLLLPAEEVADVFARSSSRPRAPRSAVNTMRLVYGSQGEAVKTLQRKLAARGAYAGKITGRLGVGTYRAWKGASKGTRG